MRHFHSVVVMVVEKMMETRLGGFGCNRGRETAMSPPYMVYQMMLLLRETAIPRRLAGVELLAMQPKTSSDVRGDDFMRLKYLQTAAGSLRCCTGPGSKRLW